MKKIAIYGGTFDPIHNGHVRAALAYLDQSDANALYIIPTAIPPHKRQASSVSANDRLKMCELAFSDRPEYGKRLFVSDYEIVSGGESYTVLTLRHFAEEANEIELLCGTDMFLILDKWYRSDEIFERAKIAYIRRECDSTLDEKIEQKKREYEERYGARVRKIDILPTVIASGDVRKSIEESANLVPGAVEEYIKSRGLYV